MDKTILIGLVFAWMSGVFFGMGLEQKLLAPRRRKVQSNDGDQSCQRPLPMLDENVTYCTDGLCCPVPAVVAHYKRRFGVNIFSLPPAADDFLNVGSDAQSEPSNG